ncbi:MAG: hypothetical protein ACK4YU_07620, partial [Paracoccus sp. (in: a-proteobacteria)]
MRRIIHNTTAIAACLSLLTPQLALAELRISDDEAATRAAAQAETRPDEAAALRAELDGGLDAAALECADGAERPCADGVGLVTPQGIPVALSEGGTIVLADAAGAPEGEGEPLAEEQASEDATEAEPEVAASDESASGSLVSDLAAALAEIETAEPEPVADSPEAEAE